MSKVVRPRVASLRIAVLQGGESAECEISRQSGAAVATALAGRGHDVVAIDPAEQPLESVDWPRFDAAFIALHGQFGEDGGVQSLLDGWGVPYTGSDAAASRLAFSKSASKERFAACEIPTPPYSLVHVSDSPRHLRGAAEQLGFPLIVKPDASGSSLGVAVVDRPEQLSAAAAHCFRYGPFGLLERAIAGTEWTLGLFDDQCLPLIRIDPRQSFFDFTAKYEDDGTGYCLDHDLPGSTLQAITDSGAAAARSLGTRGIVRVDLRVNADFKPWVLEVNTIPGFTDHSLVPKAAARLGWSLGELCERAVRSCLLNRLNGPSNAQNANLLPQTTPLREAG